MDHLNCSTGSYIIHFTDVSYRRSPFSLCFSRKNFTIKGFALARKISLVLAREQSMSSLFHISMPLYRGLFLYPSKLDTGYLSRPGFKAYPETLILGELQSFMLHVSNSVIQKSAIF